MTSPAAWFRSSSTTPAAGVRSSATPTCSRPTRTGTTCCPSTSTSTATPAAAPAPPTRPAGPRWSPTSSSAPPAAATREPVMTDLSQQAARCTRSESARFTGPAPPAGRRLPWRRAQRHGLVRLGRTGCLVRGRRAGIRAPRNPDVRLDAVRSSHPVSVELDGVVLAESPSPVMAFETGLPTRSYLIPTEISFQYLTPSDTVTSCPYKGTASRYWSVGIGETIHRDLG